MPSPTSWDFDGNVSFHTNQAFEIIMRIAYGASKLLYLYMTHGKMKFDCVIDDFLQTNDFYGLEVRRTQDLQQISNEQAEIVVFAASSKSLVTILDRLADLGFRLGEKVQLYSDIAFSDFRDSASSELGMHINATTYDYCKLFYLNSWRELQTTILGSQLFIEAINASTGLQGHIAELGIFDGGNSLCALQAGVISNQQKFYLVDSFEGFPSPSDKDSPGAKEGGCATSLTYEQITNCFGPFPNVHVVRGYIPKLFSELDNDDLYSVVLYDCDLYEPAIASYEYFWDRLIPGGYFLIHDYLDTPDGYCGVKTATDEFFVNHIGIEPIVFWHNTIAVVQKPK